MTMTERAPLIVAAADPEIFHGGRAGSSCSPIGECWVVRSAGVELQRSNYVMHMPYERSNIVW
jgi:hypothetical protein